MLRIPVLQIGLGGVGRTLVEHVLAFNGRLSARYGLQFDYLRLVDRRGALINDQGIGPALLRAALSLKQRGGALADMSEGVPLADWRAVVPHTPCIVVDVTAQDGMEARLLEVVEAGNRVVLANKKPLCAEYETFRRLVEPGRTRYEATVGAGLPIITTLRSLLDTGDHIRSIEGCFSGTLGFLMSQLETGAAFSAAIDEAHRRGWTEPDPRDDLSGVDVARKALILARTAGMPVELRDVEVESLVPPSLEKIPVDRFMSACSSLDQFYREQVQTAAQTGQKLRYVARVEENSLKVGMLVVDPVSPVGGLQGTDNLVVFRTARYDQQPLSIRGPGAGQAVTAAGVLSDMIAFAREW